MGDPLHIENNKSGPDDDDEVLWEELTASSMPAYETLYSRYVNQLYRYSFMIVRDKSIAEDVIHDVFTDLWSSRKNLGSVRSVRLYLFASIKRRALRNLKKQRGFAFFDQSMNKDLSFQITPSFLEELIRSHDNGSIARKLDKYIASLSKRQREIIYLRFYQDMSYAEIAELLELDQKYVYNLASKAFCALRKTIPGNLIPACLLFGPLHLFLMTKP